MTRNLSSLQTVARLKQREQEKAAEQLTKANAQLEGELERLATLQAYAEDYRSMPMRLAGQLRQLRDTQRFHLELQQTLELQHAAVAVARQEVEAARAEWIAARLSHGALQKLIARRAEERERGQRVAEQRRLDDQGCRSTRVSGVDEVY
ncbi:MAG: flagellar export protein FliJ [Gammaproteobacteria bacterium]|nr:MAG: flagellar export protein FliJ [Gammaproteobacteria bacterium]